VIIVARIFLALALFAVGLLVANIVLGLMTGDFNGIAREHREAYQNFERTERNRDATEEAKVAARENLNSVGKVYGPLKQRKVLHFLLGLLAALVTVLVNSITVTYFIGTSRWCREVCDIYSLGDKFPERSDALKKAAFPWAALGIGVILGIIMLGAACDPSADVESSADWVTPHFLAAIGGVCVIGFSFLVQVGKIGGNYEVIQDILTEVNRIRQEKGLDPTDDIDAAKPNGEELSSETPSSETSTNETSDESADKPNTADSSAEETSGDESESKQS